MTEIDTPEVEIEMSAFALDKHMVTIRRYRECYAAGVCMEGPARIAVDWFDDPTMQDRAIDVTHEAAATFCEWDGGRLLPSDAQWQKAVRGPAPRRGDFPDGSDSWDCGTMPIPACNGDGIECFNQPVGSFPVTDGFYGVSDLLIGAGEHTRDAYVETWWSSPESQVANPVNLDPTGETTLHGGCFTSNDVTANTVARVVGGSGGAEANFRCARPVSPAS